MNNNEHRELSDMLPGERRKHILNIIKKNQSVKVTDLSKLLYTNEATIRRDLNVLEKDGYIKRIYGGAVLAAGPDSEIPFAYRQEQFTSQKKEIAKIAAREIENGDTLFLDSSSTAGYMIPFLESKTGLKIVTNGAKTALMLAGLEDAIIISTGGILRESSLSFAGQSAYENLAEYYFDKVFFSCHAYSTENGLMDNNEDEARLRRLVVRQSKKAYLLADKSKEGKTSFYKICEIDKIYKIITNS